jgi:hypothetical protein
VKRHRYSRTVAVYWIGVVGAVNGRDAIRDVLIQKCEANTSHQLAVLKC